MVGVGSYDSGEGSEGGYGVWCCGSIANAGVNCRGLG